MTRSVLCAALVLAFALPAALCADPGPQQIVTTSWHGLSGLYVIPTARTVGKGNLGMSFNESKHTEFKGNYKFVDRQVRGTLTYGVNDSLEVTACYIRNLYKLGAGVNLSNADFYTFGFKYLLVKEDPEGGRPAVALGVRDITDETADAGPLTNVGNGRKVFLLLSKKLLRNRETGRFMDAHAGLTYNSKGTSGLLGFELTLSSNMSLIMEGMWDSPYLDFKNYGSNDQTGRFILCPGLRIYPELIPGMALDLGYVGDSEFEFSFGISYVANL